MKKARATSRLDLWRTSAQFRLIALAQCHRMNAAKAKAKRCGARRKRDGQPCQLEALENGRCYLHGGKTPKGDQWHCPVWPDNSAPNANAKLARKLQDRERAAQKRAMRLATMSPDERAAHQRWQKSHRPGSSGKRASDRACGRQDADARELLAKERPHLNADPEAVALEKAIDAARQRLAEIEARQLSDFDDQGVFG